MVGPLGIEKKNNLEKRGAIVNYGECYVRKYIDIDKVVIQTTRFVLQGRKRFGSLQNIRVGFTCSKKVGNAVLRNLAKAS